MKNLPSPPSAMFVAAGGEWVQLRKTSFPPLKIRKKQFFQELWTPPKDCHQQFHKFALCSFKKYLQGGPTV
jgi:hypothetical protein